MGQMVDDRNDRNAQLRRYPPDVVRSHKGNLRQGPRSRPPGSEGALIVIIVLVPLGLIVGRVIFCVVASNLGYSISAVIGAFRDKPVFRGHGALGAPERLTRLYGPHADYSMPDGRGHLYPRRCPNRDPAYDHLRTR